MADVVVRGAQVVGPGGVKRLDLAVEDGWVSTLAPELPGAAREIDGRGLTLFPGVIDTHVHFNEPGQAHWEGLASGSRALAAGGGTLFFDMPLNSLPCTLTATDFAAKDAAARASSVTDFALWGGLTPQNLGELDELAACGVIGFKAFMSDSGLPQFSRADEATLREGMVRAARLGLPVAVHAEDEELTSRLAGQARAAGRTGWRDYLASRPVQAELNAIARALALAKETGAALHIVHVSSGAGVALAVEARARGVDVTVETGPHYLSFTAEDLEQLGAVLKCAPPVRDAQTQGELWAQVLSGQVDMVGSDHSPSPPELKTGDDAFAVWGGVAGVQSTLSALLTEGAPRGLTLPAISDLLARHPAKRFRLAGRGELQVGAWADFTLVDLSRRLTLQAEGLYQRHRQSPYLGRTFQGVVRRTVVRGQTVYQDGEFSESFRAELVRPTPIQKQAVQEQA